MKNIFLPLSYSIILVLMLYFGFNAYDNAKKYEAKTLILIESEGTFFSS